MPNTFGRAEQAVNGTLKCICNKREVVYNLYVTTTNIILVVFKRLVMFEYYVHINVMPRTHADLQRV